MEDNVKTAESPFAGRGKALRLSLVLGVVLAVALVVGGVFIGFRGSETASGSTATGATSATDQRSQQAAQFVACMRQNGITNFPDPGAGGALSLTPESGVDIGSDSFKKAESTCRSLMPGSGEESKAPPSAAPSAVTPSAGVMATYAKCMRDNGLKNFPDLPEGKPLQLTPESGIDITTEEFKKAVEACKDKMPPLQ
jgi:hypothetical protein